MSYLSLIIVMTSVAGALTGDRAKQNEGQLQHDKGEIKSEINKS